MLRWWRTHGYINVADFSSDIASWILANLPLKRSRGECPLGDLSANPHPSLQPAQQGATHPSPNQKKRSRNHQQARSFVAAHLSYIFASEHDGIHPSPSGLPASLPYHPSLTVDPYCTTLAMTTLQNAPGFYSPKVHTVQGANSKTFSRVGLDTTLTVPELFKYHAENSPEHPVFVYMDDEKNEHIVRFPEVYRGIRKAATIASRHYERMADYYAQAQQGKSENDPPIVGILATAGSPPASCLIR
ncbi:hypothetical protein NUW54_g665 [Trametes sanguinea]|uniref:Uncharacterized protein n=1 Tax=Trametes sanguinea TaxID=158606 RepID=A0ACC1QAZ4_9APHY|nr:hypothetical protein NUW54_g665 [Trametes sanguinea]